MYCLVKGLIVTRQLTLCTQNNYGTCSNIHTHLKLPYSITLSIINHSLLLLLVVTLENTYSDNSSLYLNTIRVFSN